MKLKQLCFIFCCLVSVSLMGADDVKPDSSETKSDSQPNVENAVPVKETLKEAELEQLASGVKSYTAAFNSKDAKALSEHWSENGTFTTQSGAVLNGRVEIYNTFKTFFEKQTEKVRLEIIDPQFEIVSPSVAIERGSSLLFIGTAEPERSIYEAYYVKENQVWKLDSVEDLDEEPTSSSFEKLEPLAWLIGDWEDQEPDAGFTVSTSNTWALNKNYITSNFVITANEKPVLTGVQIIGWDPVAQTIRSWVFDSNGGFGGGAWTNTDGKWSVRSLFVTGEGEKASAINIYRPVDENNFVYESVGRQRGTELLPSVKKNITRRLE